MIAVALGLVLLPGTWVVDDDGGSGVDFTDLPAAVAAAADGDLILVRAGTYSHFVLDGKGLCIIGAGETTEVVLPGPAGRRTTISALPAAALACCERMKFGGAGFDTCRIEIRGASTRALLADLSVSGPLDDGHGYPALRVADAELQLFDSVLTGGPGASPSPFYGVAGGSALELESRSRAFVVGSTLRGGSGAGAYANPGSGGDALRVHSGAHLWVASCVLNGGSGAFSASGLMGGGGRGSLASAAFLRISGAAGAGVFGGAGRCPPALGIAALGGARVVVHAVPVLYGFFPYGGCGPLPQTSGFEQAAPLPVLAVTGTPLGNLANGALRFELSNGPPRAPFVIRALPASAARLARRLESDADGPLLSGERVLDPDRSRVLATGRLSPAGAASISFQAGPGVPLHVPLLFQAELPLAPGRTLLSNPAQLTLRD